MVRAISFGVFCRCAPSTSAIIRSTNDSPGFAVIRTTMWSESTVVPPVTEEKSPPDSRTTGADSPVIADSSTVAMPSTISPSPGMTCPASTTTRSPTRRSVAGTSSTSSSGPIRWATVSVLVERRASACARPRPSATASARFANTTVNHSQTAIDQANTLGSRIADTVTTTEPTHTTNITGLRTWWRGSSLRRAVGSDSRSCRGRKAPAPTARPVRVAWSCSASAGGRASWTVVMPVPPRGGSGRGRGGR